MLSNKEYLIIINNIDRARLMNIDNEISYKDTREILRVLNVDYEEQIMVINNIQIPQIVLNMEGDKILTLVFEGDVLTFIEISV